MPLPISIQSLTKTYRGRHGTVHAVNDISLDINPGELFFLLGPSGCGKTTLLRMIAGFIEPDPHPNQGTIHFADRDVTHTPPNKRNTAMVFQSYALWPHMTVAQNVAFGLNVRKTPTDERDKRVAEALEAVQLAQYAQRKPNELSGGQQQRVALARALVIRPDVLLLDEPLSNLDAKLRADLRLQVRNICKASGITSVYVTHDQQEALSMADRIAIMRDGKLEQIGTPRALYTTPRSVFVANFLGDTNIIDGEIAKPSESTERPINTGSIGPEDDSDLIVVRTPLGTLAARSSDHQTGKVSILIRPEAIRFLPPGQSPGIPAQVQDLQYLGSSTACRIKIANTDLIATAPAAFAATDSAKVEINPSDIVVLAR